jgi:hypothetical protein
MAIWQFTIDLYPEAGLLKELRHIPDVLPKKYLRSSLSLDDDFGEYVDPTTIFWKDISAIPFVDQLDSKLSRIEWLADAMDIISWGNSDTNDVTLTFNKRGEVETLGCRIDMRTIEESFIELILEIASANKLMISNTNGNIIQPSRTALGNLMSNSNASNFVANPQRFIADFISRKRKPE